MNRDNSLDCVASILIIFMILGHAFLWKIILMIVGLLLSYLGTIANGHHLIIPPILWEVSAGSFFFLCGYYMRNISSNRKIVIFAFLIYILATFFIPSTFDFRKGSLSRGIWLIYILSSVAGIIVFLYLFKLPLLNRRLFGYIGRHSLQFFSLHWVLFDMICLLFGYQMSENGKVFGDCFSKQADYGLFWSLLVGCALLIPVYIFLLSHIKRIYKSGFISKI